MKKLKKNLIQLGCLVVVSIASCITLGTFFYYKLFATEASSTLDQDSQGVLFTLESCGILFSTALITSTVYYKLFDMHQEIELTKKLFNWRIHVMHLGTAALLLIEIFILK